MIRLIVCTTRCYRSVTYGTVGEAQACEKPLPFTEELLHANFQDERSGGRPDHESGEVIVVTLLSKGSTLPRRVIL